MILILVFIVLFYLATASSAPNKKSKSSSIVTRKTIEVNLKDYPNEYIFDVKGVHLEKYSHAVFNYCKVNDVAILVPEPSNRYDSKAIRVEVNGWEIGYVPKEETQEVHKIINKEHFAYVENHSIYGYVSVSINIRYK